MLLRYFYDKKLAHASYLVGCQKTGEAIVIDPGRNLKPYLQAAKEEGLNITAAAETHIHADFVSGARELGATHQAKLYLSDEGDADWKYQYVDEVKHRLVKDGDRFSIGNLMFEVMHTPGHTPESISFLLTVGGENADRPIGIFTGDFVFAGDIGRPDLLEKATGIKGTSESGARAMFKSLMKFKQLPDYLQVWPAHGAGSACGKALGAIPTSTVGYEKMFNWAMAYTDEEEFVKALLDGQPEPPKYFAEMKRVNKEGPALLKDLSAVLEIMLIEQVKDLQGKEQIVDTRCSREFAEGHIKGTINIPFNKAFTNWAGWLIDYNRPVYFITYPAEVNELVEALRSVGIDNIAGFMDRDKILESGAFSLESYAEIIPLEIAKLVEDGFVHVLDVRNLTEWQEGHIPNAQHIMLGTLPERLDEIRRDCPILVQCHSGARSAIGASILQANGGFKQVLSLSGGIVQWQKDGLAISTPCSELK
ncbi:MBL fold metallo-hydrolase [Bacillus licheniformis]|uniref:MBL fold metallo-hydrolase n=1 Tax=Bacillus licheniformis TaxID=1402 RepID=UPI00228199A0|nr:MBL fold metallo-hydrolase [Bacillus licheniformis]MCY7776312.1 MBL fold metallo-hydrolase [Bacillus licheniformis]MCY7956828.1 MBL fold metallo-hydrolase [Bacillus licheniformis]MCY8020960.1 MBL fold metallo-hydrolase [Bacillus licheniformis]MCY8157216.1 MBL fold metallo-hydrolase [Bacillus licheniformis]MCY8529153.1 MBL fold metallo-hydrolase [Bacillus licheniformis]